MGQTIGELLDDQPSVETLATRCGLPAEKIGRLVNFLAADKALDLTADGRVAHTPGSRRLPALAGAVHILAMNSQASPVLYDALKRGVSAFEASNGKPVFAHFAEHPEAGAQFVEFMGILNQRTEAFVFAAHDFKPFRRAVDVGGSHGGLLLGLLARHTDARGILFDLPETAAQVAPAVLASPQGERVDVVAGDFFRAVPTGDLYLLKQILHDWSDDECVAILKSIRTAIAPGGRIAVIDFVLPERPAMTDGLVMDIAMMIWATGRERKVSEFQALFVAAGFAFDRITENPRGQSVIEAVPV